MPPEAFDDCATSDPRYDAPSWDIYSTGVILYELWYRGHPWEKFQTMQIFGRLARKNRPPFQPLFDGGPGGNIPKPLEELISKLWKDAPSDRPPISKAAEEFRAHVIPLLLGGEGGGGSLMSVPDPKDQSDVVLVSDPDFDIPPPPEQVPSPQSTAI